MNESRLPTLAFVVTLCATLASPSANAQAFDAVRLYGAAHGQDIGLAGAAILVGPAYLGSDEHRTLVLPVIDYQWANGWFAGTTNGIGYEFSDRQEMQYGVRLTADLGRQESRSSALRGMGDVDAQVEFGGFLNYLPSPEWTLTSSLRVGTGQKSNGLVVDLGAAYDTEIAAQWRLGLGAVVSLANPAHMQTFFGVSASQTATSSYSSYESGAGVRNARASVALTYLYSPRVTITTGFSVNTLLGNAADSPLVRKKNSVDGLLVAAYSF